MKQKLLILLFAIFVSTISYSQVANNQVDDFEDGTQGWTEGCCSPNDPTSEVGGIDGKYINNISAGGVGGGSRLSMYNTTQWVGDYVAAGIEAISMQVRNNSAVALNLRVAFGQSSAGSSAAHWVSTTSIDIPASSGWTTIVFPIAEAFMSKSITGDLSFTYAQVMEACAIMRILSAATVSHKGDAIVGDLDVDNVRATTVHELNWFTNIGTNVDLTINSGDTVTWTWTDALPHNVVSNTGSVETFDSGFKTGIGQTFSYTFTSVGTNPYLCGVHGAASMSGTITVEAALGIDKVALNEFSISPNPGRDKLNLKLSKLNTNTNLEVFDVLGKKIYANRLIDVTTSVDVSNWNSGVYLVRLTNDIGTLTKRFVKH